MTMPWQADTGPSRTAVRQLCREYCGATGAEEGKRCAAPVPARSRFAGRASMDVEALRQLRNPPVQAAQGIAQDGRRHDDRVELTDARHMQGSSVSSRLPYDARASAMRLYPVQ